MPSMWSGLQHGGGPRWAGFHSFVVVSTYQRLLLTGMPPKNQAQTPATASRTAQVNQRTTRARHDGKVTSTLPAWTPRNTWNTLVRQPATREPRVYTPVYQITWHSRSREATLQSELLRSRQSAEQLEQTVPPHTAAVRACLPHPCGPQHRGVSPLRRAASTHPTAPRGRRARSRRPAGCRGAGTGAPRRARACPRSRPRRPCSW